jgi:hypothetical protein
MAPLWLLAILATITLLPVELLIWNAPLGTYLQRVCMIGMCATVISAVKGWARPCKSSCLGTYLCARDIPYILFVTDHYPLWSMLVPD